MAPPDVKIWMPIYTGDLMKEVIPLTLPQVGAYVLLQVYYWSNSGKPITDDDELLARITKQSAKQFKSMKQAVLEQFFKLTKDGWKSDRLDYLIAEAIENRLKNVERGRHAANTRWERERAKKNAKALAPNDEEIP